MRKPRVKVEVGQIYGQLTVVEWAGISPTGKIKHYWKVACTCGSLTRKRADLLKLGKCVECGRKEQAQAMLGKNSGENNSRYIKDRVQYSLMKKAKAIVKTTKYPMELTAEEVYKIITSPCTYCGTLNDLTDAKKGKWPVGINGLDRIDSSKAYTKNNVVSCCKKCNYMKNIWTVEEFFNHVKKISRHNNLE